MNEGMNTLFIEIKHPEQDCFYPSFRAVRCIHCKAAARIFGGHFHMPYDRGIHVLVGKCAKCHDSTLSVPAPYEHTCVGCYGKWKAVYGILIELSGVKRGGTDIEFTTIL